ncbi:MAG: hypothetical protein CVT48_04915 [Thermoplasmata archaeon HGW-Thermoplasmata-1]|nr:MAG: hypothetical protein CVT48_04915 [Thermoplasmata archaeon HGW-Thermoplasmata-1]
MVDSQKPAKEFDVVTIGSSCMDIIMHVDDIIRLNFMDRDGSERKYTAIEYSTKANVVDVHYAPGGSAANIAANLSQLGFKTAYIGKLGNDVNGTMCIDDMKRNGVNLDGVLRTDEDCSAVSIILITPWGRDRSILTYKGANDRLTPQDVKYDLLKKSRAFAWTSLTTDNGIAAIEESIKVCHDNGGIVLGAPSRSIISKNPEGFKKLLKHTDLLSFNEEELESFTGEKIFTKAIEKMLAYGPRLVCVTMGSKGSIITDGQTVVETGTFHVEVKDTTGAGDAFASGVLFGYLKGRDLQSIGKLAAALAAKEIMSPGVRIGIPHSEEELWDFIMANKVKQTSHELQPGESLDLASGVDKN